METSRAKRRRLISIHSHFSSWPHVPAIFESLNDDTLTTILEFVGKKSYRSFGGTNKRCKEVYLNTPGMTKETFLYGYAPLSVIIDRYDSEPSFKARNALCKGVVFYNRRDVLDWVLQRRETTSSKDICEVAAEEGRIDILEEMWNKVTGDRKRFIFGDVDVYAAGGGKLNVLEWHETKGLSINKMRCPGEAAEKGHLHIIQWLREEKGLELFRDLYLRAIWGSHLHVMKWLREQGCPWSEYNFQCASMEGKLDILKWLHNEGCSWPEDDCVHEEDLKPEVIDWCRVNGYGNRVYRD